MDYRSYIFENMKNSREKEYLMSMYPTEARKMQRAVEDAVGILDYEGSMIYDDYPDKRMLRKLMQSIYRQLFEVEGIEEEKGKRDLIDILVIQDIMKRRESPRKKKYIF